MERNPKRKTEKEIKGNSAGLEKIGAGLCALAKIEKDCFVDVVAERGRAVRQGGGGDVMRNFVSFSFDGGRE